jgi:periplasmic protein TonB
MMALSREEIADLRRWAICGAVIVLAHGAIAAGMVTWSDTIEPAEPAAAIVIEFAPVPVAPAIQRADIPPGPEQVMSDASPSIPTDSLKETIEEKVEQKVEARLEQKVEEKLETKPMEEPPPEVAPAPDPEVAVPPPAPQEVKQETPKRQELRAPAPVTTAPQAIPDQVAALPAAPAQGQLNPNNTKAVVTWRTQVVALIERNKHYPEVSRSRREEGVARIFFSLDRQGRVIESRIVRSSGTAALDEEALALLRRAQPFPEVPSDIPGERINLLLPLRFNLK